MIPPLKNRIVIQKMAPMMYCHTEASDPELKLNSHRLIKNAPITAPKTVPLPPIATQMIIVIENEIVIWEGVMLPLKLTNNAPPIHVRIADRV